MHGVYELKEMLIKELEDYGTKRDLSAGSLDVIDKLAHTIKNIIKILDCYEEDSGDSFRNYSGRRSGYRGNYSGRRKPYGNYSNYYDNGQSGARISFSDGNYSRHNDDLVERLRYLMDDVHDERTRMEIENIIKKVEEI